MGDKINVDNSALTPIAECTTKAALKGLKLGGKGDRDAMDAGSVMHDGLQKHYEGGTKDESMDAFHQAYYTYFPPEKPAEEDRLSYGNLKDIFSVYIDRHRVDNQPFEVINAEEIVGCPLDDKGEIIIWGKRDLMVRDKATGFVMPLDHKTTGRVEGYWQAKWRLSSQLAGYCWMVQKETGEMCPAAYVNAIEMGGLPNSTRKCAIHKMPYNECRLEHTKFALLYYEYTNTVMDGWRATAIMLARKFEKIKKNYPSIEMVEYAPMEGMFINGVCPWCEYKQYCRAGKPAHLLNQYLYDYEFAPWKEDSARFFDWRTYA